MSATTEFSSPADVSIRDIPRWPTEMGWFAFAVVVSIPIWVLLIVTIIGALYAGLIALVLTLIHARLIFHVRGSGIRIGPDQMPALHQRVEELAKGFGMERAPATYVMQAGGSLNAFATKFFGGDMMVLYTDLLEACGTNDRARDMIIGHELGHIRAAHLKWRWLIAPGLILPFMGGALSRAREFTCDRYGLAAAGDHAAAELGLTILAAGGGLARHVNRDAWLAQQKDLGGFWMTMGRLLSTHPALARRVAALANFHV